MRLSKQLAVSGAPPKAVRDAESIFDPNAFTIGFARRFAAYKRPTLLLHDEDKLLRILTDPNRPVQLIISGKAHPADSEGKALIEQWIRFINREETKMHVVFLSDYDMHLTERLVQGVDLWLNNPRRPWEACGTSGMKVLVNGGLNLSELDGWWAEAYAPDIGWALGDGLEHGEDPEWDAREAEALYATLEQKIIPEFYTRGENGVPRDWVARMRESMARLSPRFSSNRMLREYTEEYYIPLAESYRKRSSKNGAMGTEITKWKHNLEQFWPNLRFGELKVETDGGMHKFEVQVYLNGVEPDSARVELFADGEKNRMPFRQVMKRGRALVGAMNGFVYGAEVPAKRPASDYTPRVIPYFPGVAVPLETSQILWRE